MSSSFILPDGFNLTGLGLGLKDSLARLRVSLPSAIWEGSHIYDKNTLIWAEELTGGGTSSTYNANARLVELNPGTTNGNKVVRQSRSYMYYQPGRGHLVMMTGVMGTAQSQTTQEIGYFDNDNGVFFRQNGTTKSVVRRSKVTGSIIEEVVTQNDWNLDKLDGTGESEIIIDWTKTQIFVIEFEWLGVGIVRFGFVLDGSFVYCHQMNHANVLDVPWMGTPNLPVRYETKVISAGASSAVMKCICGIVMAESGFNPIGKPFSANRGSSSVSISNGNEAGIIAIRPQSSFSRLAWNLTHFISIATSLDAYLARIYFAPTITGGSWTAVTNSRMEVNTSLTGFSGGHVIDSAYAAQRDILLKPIESLLRPGNSVAGTNRDTILLTIQALGTGTFTGGLNWIEFE